MVTLTTYYLQSSQESCLPGGFCISLVQVWKQAQAIEGMHKVGQIPKWQVAGPSFFHGPSGFPSSIPHCLLWKHGSRSQDGQIRKWAGGWTPAMWFTSHYFKHLYLATP